jgi:hypothetical protein
LSISKRCRSLTAIPDLVARHAVYLEAIQNIVDQIVREHNAEGIALINLFEQALRAERAVLEEIFVNFRAGRGAVVNDPIARRLVEARAQFTLSGFDEAIASLTPRPAAGEAFKRARAE